MQVILSVLHFRSFYMHGDLWKRSNSYKRYNVVLYSSHGPLYQYNVFSLHLMFLKDNISSTLLLSSKYLTIIITFYLYMSMTLFSFALSIKHSTRISAASAIIGVIWTKEVKFHFAKLSLTWRVLTKLENIHWKTLIYAPTQMYVIWHFPRYKYSLLY